jgi:polar amino acid transport system substrate-binding protein
MSGSSIAAVTQIVKRSSLRADHELTGTCTDWRYPVVAIPVGSIYNRARTLHASPSPFKAAILMIRNIRKSRTEQIPMAISPTSDSIIRHPSFVIRRLSLLIGHCSLFILLAACARPDDTWDRVRETGVLRVGMDASFPPFETIAADGSLVGFDVDIARELGRRIGVEVQFVANLPYDGLYDALAVGRVDAVISALIVNPARMADFAYSNPYFDAGQVLVIQGEESEIKGMPDLSRRTLAVEFGTQGDLEARKWARRLSGLTVVPYQTASEALATVAVGEADAALVDHVSALVAIARTSSQEQARTCLPLYGVDLVVVGKPVVEEPYAVAVHRDSRYLLRAINDALAGMEADGTLEALTTKWLGGD